MLPFVHSDLVSCWNFIQLLFSLFRADRIAFNILTLLGDFSERIKPSNVGSPQSQSSADFISIRQNMTDHFTHFGTAAIHVGQEPEQWDMNQVSVLFLVFLVQFRTVVVSFFVVTSAVLRCTFLIGTLILFFSLLVSLRGGAPTSN